MGGILVALVEEVYEQLGGPVALIRIDVEARNSVDDDLSWSAVHGGEGWEAAGHRLDDG